jgi:hypothetical protein
LRLGVNEEIKDAIFPGWSDIPKFDGHARFKVIRWEGTGISGSLLDASYVIASLYRKIVTYGA